MSVLEQLQEITKLDEDVQFFADNFEELSNESSCPWLLCFIYSNSVAIELESDTLNYRIYDPFRKVTQNYKYPNGYTEWSLRDPFCGGVK